MLGSRLMGMDGDPLERRSAVDRAEIERLHGAKHLADLHTSALLQAAVYRFCERRLLDRHAARVAGEYGQRRTMLVDSLRKVWRFSKTPRVSKSTSNSGSNPTSLKRSARVMTVG